MLKIILAILVAGALALAGFVALQPSTYTVSRSILIAAPPSAVFPLVNEVRQWETWSPWSKRDPNMTLTYEGPPSGPGASYSWAGNREVGKGRLTVISIVPDQQVDARLNFVKPFQDTASSTFSFSPQAGLAKVTWTMSGHCNLVAKALHLFIDMDKMIGQDFEEGLASIKSLVEKKAAP